MNYINLGVSALAFALLCVAGIMPSWLTFPAVFDIGWINRLWGLLKVTGKFTNIMLSGADIPWMELRDGVCSASAAWTTGTAGSSAMGMASAIGNAMQGVTCPPLCKQHIALRCATYYKATTVNFAVFGMLVTGGLVSIVGSTMPLIGKERKKDRTTWLMVDLIGFLLAAGGCATYYFVFSGMLDALRLTGWFPMQTFGWCFMLACAASALLIVPVVIQLVKIATTPEKKTGDDSQLLTSGASPEFMMPTAI